jgi:class 3 adenylate cyclase
MNKTNCAIMFVDIGGSTQLYDQLGDEVAKETIDKCLALLSDIVVAQQGVVVKTIGDELMCRFDTAAEAILAAIASQTDIGRLEITAMPYIAIRAAVHFGEVIVDSDDIFGDAVNIAARMTGISRTGQIVTTESTVKVLPEELRSRTRQIDLVKVKGKQEKLAVYEVLWEQEERVTKISTDLLSRTEGTKNALTLSHGSDSLELADLKKPITIGRSAKCTFVVDTPLASREHALIELRRGKYVITDQGTNGT